MLEKYIRGKVAVFIDAANIIYSQRSLGWKVDYLRLIKYLNQFSLIGVFFYYGTLKENKKQQKFFDLLRKNQYHVVTKPVKYINTPKGRIFKGNLDIELAYDLLRLDHYYETCVLMSGDSDFEILLRHLRLEGKQTIVISTRGHISIELIKACHKYIDLKKFKSLIQKNTSQ